jgi:hypothetical protein
MEALSPSLIFLMLAAGLVAVLGGAVFLFTFLGSLIWALITGRGRVSEEDRLDEEWRERLKTANGLADLGFLRSPENYTGEGAREIVFVGKHFCIVIGRMFGRDGSSYTKYIRKWSKEPMPSPEAALLYFSDDREAVLARYRVAQTALERDETFRYLLRANRWLIETGAWMDDPGLAAAENQMLAQLAARSSHGRVRFEADIPEYWR